MCMSAFAKVRADPDNGNAIDKATTRTIILPRLLARTAGKLTNQVNKHSIKAACGNNQAAAMQRNGAGKEFFAAVAHMEQHENNAMVVLLDSKGCFPNTNIVEASKSLCDDCPDSRSGGML